MSTGIEWTSETWNPVRGCARVSEGCRNCYAERVAHRFSGPGQPYEGLTVAGKDGPRWAGRARFVEEMLGKPLGWRKPRRVFVNSMSDLFHGDITNEQIAAVFGVMAACPQHTFQALTKQVARMLEWFTWASAQAEAVIDGSGESLPDACHAELAVCALAGLSAGALSRHLYNEALLSRWPLPNVHIGVSVEDQRTAAERVPLLLQTPAAVRWVSYEPALGAVDFTHLDADGAGHKEWCQINALTGRHTDMGRPCRDVPRLDWVVVGGESGPGARPCRVKWIRDVVRWCREAAVPVFVKQLGARPDWTGYGHLPEHVQHCAVAHDRRASADALAEEVNRYGGGIVRLNDPKAGDPSEWPEDLRVREWPEVSP